MVVKAAGSALPQIGQASSRQAKVHRHGKRLSVQSFAILPKIREVDARVGQDPDLLTRLIDVHPELSFCCWNDAKPLLHSKKTSLGR